MNRGFSEQIRQVLATVGPLTSRELVEFFPDRNHRDVTSALCRMRDKLMHKRVYIAEWTRDNGYGRTVLRPVFALGDKTCAQRPRTFNNAQRCKRYRDKNRVPKINSVWSLGAHG